MNEQECLDKMVAPGTRRPGKFREGVTQIHVTRACDMSCIHCTQGSNLGGKNHFMSPEMFEQAVLSLSGYFGVVGVFGGNPALSPFFEDYCSILRKHVPFKQRGLWCNNPAGKGRVMRETFDPSVSNLNVHLSRPAYEEFKRDWPECNPVGLLQDSRHSPCYVSMKDVGIEESVRWELISKCDINQHWSAMLGMFRGTLRAWFCEVAGAQSILHQYEYDYPDTGLDPTIQYEVQVQHPSAGHLEKTVCRWWELGMSSFSTQVFKHCHDCGVPLKGYGELATAHDGREQVSAVHLGVYKPKRKGRMVELVTVPAQLGNQLDRMTDYIGNSKR